MTVCVCFYNLIGDIHIIKELMLVNDNLKWRLEQRNRAIAASELIINGLKLELHETRVYLDQIITQTAENNNNNVSDE